MIFVSSSCVKTSRIDDAVLKLAKNGFYNIELSGGTTYYRELERDLLQLKVDYGLQYQVHNYFPPPIENFVLNLASLNKDIFKKSILHCKKAIDLAEKLGVCKYGVHAGFLIDPCVNELGKGFGKDKLSDRSSAIANFCQGYSELKKYSDNVEIYIENNVISKKNYTNFGINPFLLTDYDSLVELQQNISFKLLLDMAHLKVSCNTLGLDFENQTLKMAGFSDYLHISDNDGREDSNKYLVEGSEVLDILKHINCRDKTITLEIYESLDSIKESSDMLKKIIYET